MLEVFKNTVPNRLYWVLFPIDNLREAVETAKRFLTKEKIDRQMTRQSSTPFMKLNEKKGKNAVSFDRRHVLQRNSKNMERMTVLMDKILENSIRKMYLISLRYIRREEEVRTGRILDRIILIGEEI